MLPLSAPPTFTFENDARGMNGRYREAASQRSTIKPMAGLGRPRAPRKRAESRRLLHQAPMSGMGGLKPSLRCARMTESHTVAFGVRGRRHADFADNERVPRFEHLGAFVQSFGYYLRNIGFGLAVRFTLEVIEDRSTMSAVEVEREAQLGGVGRNLGNRTNTRIVVGGDREIARPAKNP